MIDYYENDNNGETTITISKSEYDELLRNSIILDATKRYISLIEMEDSGVFFKEKVIEAIFGAKV